MDKAAAGRIGAYVTHSRYDPRAITSAARSKFLDRFAREVDPEGLLDPAERERRATFARKAYMTRLAQRSAAARARRAGK